jgi:hypothetical protein
MTRVSPGSCTFFSISILQGVYTFLTPFSGGWQLQDVLLSGEGASSPRAQCTSCKHDEMEVVIPTNLDMSNGSREAWAPCLEKTNRNEGLHGTHPKTGFGSKC